ncbi:hypothetical protein [Aquipuribacter sp. SD81]|uniref:hypothetical protein n=1 Tax=Aquipuribacter sp. SD81 TaxID=3127703 RepID=UPI003016CBB9
MTDRRYRTPRYGVFLLTGAVVGAVAALAVAYLGASAEATGGQSTFLFFAVAGAFLGALVLGVLAVLLERVLNRGRPDPLRRRPD